jgi:hypothetical protein
VWGCFEERLCKALHVDASFPLESGLANLVLAVMAVPAERNAPFVARLDPGAAVRPIADVGALDRRCRSTGGASVMSDPRTVRWTTAALIGALAVPVDAGGEH